MRLSEAFLRGFYYKPRIDYDLLERHCEGLICMSACLAGDIPQRLLQEIIARRKRWQSA
jgi:DNA polymerase-3 subunit alpha